MMRVSKVRPGVPGRNTSLFLLSAVTLALLIPGSYEDFGDTGDSSPSVLQTWLGVSSEVTMVVFAALSGLLVLATGATLVTAIIELGEADKTKQQRLDALNAALTQDQTGSRHGFRGPQR